MIDLSEYGKRILSDEDRPLFDEAIEIGKAGAFRASYILIWLSCAESLKRRFREAQKRDGDAGKIVGEIESKEKDQRAVDIFLLNKAKNYGFISDSSFTILTHIYEMRCIYGHPYEEMPSKEQVSHAAASVVDLVLSKPVRLKHGFAKQLIRNLLDDRNYLDDQETAVISFTKDVIPRIDESIFEWLLETYWKGLEKIADDSTMTIFFNRGIWFSWAMIKEVGVNIFSHEKWHEKSMEFPKTLMEIGTLPDIFKDIGSRAQDSLVGTIISKSEIRTKALTHLESLNDHGVLSERQKDRFIEFVSKMKSTDLISSGLSTKICYEKLVSLLKSHDWNRQNPAIALILSNGPEQAAKLDESQQVELGRNILQSAEGKSRSALAFLEKLIEVKSWPLNLIRGIVLETFINENLEIRFKECNLDKVLIILKGLNKRNRDRIIREIVELIEQGSPKKWVTQEDFQKIVEYLEGEGIAWITPLIESLQSKANTVESRRRR